MFGNVTYFDILPKNEEEAFNEGKEEVAINLLRDGFSEDYVSKIAELPLAKINSLSY